MISSSFKLICSHLSSYRVVETDSRKHGIAHLKTYLA